MLCIGHKHLNHIEENTEPRAFILHCSETWSKYRFMYIPVTQLCIAWIVGRHEDVSREHNECQNVFDLLFLFSLQFYSFFLSFFFP